MAAGRQSRPIVVIVGSVNVDLMVAAERLPGRGETVLGRRLERYGGGKGANAAVAAARLGAQARLVAAVGDDALGQEALAELRQEDGDVEGVSTVSGEATGAALIVVDASGDNQIAVGAGANAALAPDRVRRALEGVLDRAGCLLVSLEVPHEAVRVALDAGRGRACRSSSTRRRLARRLSSSPPGADFHTQRRGGSRADG